MNVQMLQPMSGLETEEPILRPGRIDVLLGQGQTAQVLRNLCLMVRKDAPEDWDRVVSLIGRLFSIKLGTPTENVRGSIDLSFTQKGAKRPFDIALAGHGLQQILLISAYLYVHRRSVLLINEPDAHLEILRQKQVYLLLRDIAEENESQVVMVTHSEVILDEALDHNMTLLLEGDADNLAKNPNIRRALEHYGAEHYIRARECGYVLYVEGNTDVDILKALAKRLDHPVIELWNERMNTFYTRNIHPHQDIVDTELERVEGGLDRPPRTHFHALSKIIPGLLGLAIRDSDGRPRQDSEEGRLRTVYWRRYEIENYLITPAVLLGFVEDTWPLFRTRSEEVLDALILERIFGRVDADLVAWKRAPEDSKRLVWEAKTDRIKLSTFAEEFFRRLGEQLRLPMPLRKRDFHQLARFADPASISAEVGEKLDRLEELFRVAPSNLPPP